MKTIEIGDVSITSIVERDGPWRRPEEFFVGYDAQVARRHLRELDPIVFDPASGRINITYQTFVVRTPRHVVLIDTCTGDHKGYPFPMDFPKQPWLENFKAAGLRFEDVDYVFCTHLHVDHTGWNTLLREGRWVPTFPNATYLFHRDEYVYYEAASNRSTALEDTPWKMNCLPVFEAGQAQIIDDSFALDDTFWLTPTPGHSIAHCCVNIRSGGQHAVVTGDLMHHALQCREPGWSTIFDTDKALAAKSRSQFLHAVADTSTLILPVHFPSPTVGRVSSDGERFHYRFVR